MRVLRDHVTGRLALRRGLRPVIATLSTGVLALAFGAPAALAGLANGGLPGAPADPIAGLAWGTTRTDDLWDNYLAASGADRVLLGKLAEQPRAMWLGYWSKVSQVREEAATVVAATQNGNPDALVQFATYELNPWEKNNGLGAWRGPTHGSWNVKSDEAWYRNMAAGIGSARALVIEQVDLPFARKTTSTAPEQIDTYAARTLSALPHTTVYIDGGTSGWLTAAEDAKLLLGNGIRYARGFALDDTDYDPTSTEDEFGARIIAALAKLGVTGKHFIVDTDENGQPYKPYQVAARAINDTPACHGRIQTVCQRTGIPPTTNVASPAWHLGLTASRDAARYVDGYVWSGRPWDFDAGPFNRKSALWLAANSEYPLRPPATTTTGTTSGTTTTTTGTTSGTTTTGTTGTTTGTTTTATTGT